LKALEPGGHELSAEDVLRARLYAFLSRVFGAAPDEETLQAMRQLGRDATPLGRALGDLADTAAHFDPAAAETEYTVLFIGLTEGQVVPFGSYYKTGFLYEKPLAELRRDLRELGVERDSGHKEPEDHVAALFEVMHGMIIGEFGAPADVATQKRFYDAHIAGWVPKFLNDLENAEAAVLYRPVARIAALFLAIEEEAFTMA